MTEVPHLFARTAVTLAGKLAVGICSEGLPPKWFTKNPRTTFEEDLPEMLEVIARAAHLAEAIAQSPVSFFELWEELHRQQNLWAESRKIPPLLANLGVSMVERAVLDALCRGMGTPLASVVRSNGLGLGLGKIYPELGDAEPCDLLPESSLPSCFIRHTIGLGDALGAGDVSEAEKVCDGLPQDLESSIRHYGLRYFKLKLFADPARDLPRLRALTRLLLRETGGHFAVTLDGNENFENFAALREFWEKAESDPALHELWQRIIVVEQPVHRDRALTAEAGAALASWPDRPKLIIDESDGALGDLPRALTLGYAGTSHKNCKGIVKGIANACLLEKRRHDGQLVVLTGEDLCTLGPVALLQDLAMMALLGIEHVERNGHHYYRGLSPWPSDWQNTARAAHSDLYTNDPGGFVRLDIRKGQISLASINAAPFGVKPLFDPSGFEQLRIDY